MAGASVSSTTSAGVVKTASASVASLVVMTGLEVEVVIEAAAVGDGDSVSVTDKWGKLLRNFCLSLD